MSSDSVRRQKAAIRHSAGDGKSNRVRVLEFIRKRRAGATREEIIKALFPGCQTNGILGVILRGEMAAPRPSIRCDLEERHNQDVRVYFITKAGYKRLDNGLVDSYAKENYLRALGRGRNDPTQQSSWEKLRMLAVSRFES